MMLLCMKQCMKQCMQLELETVHEAQYQATEYLTQDQGTEWRTLDAERMPSNHGGLMRNQDTTAIPTTSPAAMASYQDRIMALENGKKLRIKGTKHIHELLEHGNASSVALVKCPCCRTVSQVCGISTKALYCVKCGCMSPIEVCQIPSQQQRQVWR
jgi:hypothetical protein